ncbi:hypothetical protein AAG587_17705 [Vreelandella neptunia]|uniref:hypothetical protein n=1 Tax=Vreelandella neptunia TaxID=115551 RepID=UPI00315AE915
MELNEMPPETPIPTGNMAIQIDLEYTADRKCVMRLVAVVNQDGRLQAEEIYGYSKERSDLNELLTLYPLLLTDVNKGCRCYQAEWGDGEPTETFIDFLDRPLAEGQEIERVDTSEGVSERSVYAITSITPWLGVG